MLPRLFPLALVMVEACHPTSDVASSRLTGKWKHRLQYTKKAEAEIRSRGEDPAPSLAEIGIGISKYCPNDCEAFLADGTWFLNSHQLPSGSLPLVDLTERATWLVVEEHADRVSIRIPGDEKFDDWHRTFVFETPDTICEVGGDFDGMIYDRITTR